MSTLPDFALAPWELPPGSSLPLVAPADLVFNGPWFGGSFVTFLVRGITTAKGPRFFFRLAESDDPGNFYLVGFSGDRLERVPGYLRNISLVGARISQVRRLFHFDGSRYGFPGTHVLGVGMKQNILLSWHDDPDPDNLVHFAKEPNGPRQFFELRAADVGRALCAQLEDENSEARFALQWLHLSDFERQKRATLFEQGSLEELHALMRAVLQTQCSLWDVGVTVSWEAQFEEADEESWLEDNDDFEENGDWLDYEETPYSLRRPVPPRLYHWKGLLRLVFQPSHNWDFIATAGCIGERHLTMDVTVEPPSNHEILEAHLRLSQWLRPRVSPERFKQLMGQMG